MEYEIHTEEFLRAPVQEGQKIGEIIFRIDGEEVIRKELSAQKEIPRIGIWKMFLKMFRMWSCI